MEQAPNEFMVKSESDLSDPYVSPRHDGWTAGRQEAFLKAVAQCGCVAHACAAVGMSRQSFYDLCDRPAAIAFRRALEAALDSSLRRVDEGVISRSIHGVARPIFHKGEQVGEYRHYDERLAMFLLRTRRPHRYGAHLDRLPPPPIPVCPPGCEDEGLDPDEALGMLDFYLGDLVDEADLPGGVSESSRACDGDNFVNFGGNDDAQNRHAEQVSASTTATHAALLPKGDPEMGAT